MLKTIHYTWRFLPFVNKTFFNEVLYGKMGIEQQYFKSGSEYDLKAKLSIFNIYAVSCTKKSLSNI